jgi:hypothetical protein
LFVAYETSIILIYEFLLDFVFVLVADVVLKMLLCLFIMLREGLYFQTRYLFLFWFYSEAGGVTSIVLQEIAEEGRLED